MRGHSSFLKKKRGALWWRQRRHLCCRYPVLETCYQSGGRGMKVYLEAKPMGTRGTRLSSKLVWSNCCSAPIRGGGGVGGSCFSQECSQDSLRVDVSPEELDGAWKRWAVGASPRIPAFLESTASTHPVLRDSFSFPSFLISQFPPSAIPAGSAVGPVIRFPGQYYGCQQHSKIPVIDSSGVSTAT